MDEKIQNVINENNAEYVENTPEILTEETVEAEKVIKDESTEEENKTVESETKNGEEFEQTYKEMSPARLVMRRFFRSKLSIVGIVMIVFLFAFSFLGPVIYTKWSDDVPDESGKIENEVIDANYTENGEEIKVKMYFTLVSGQNTLAPPSKDHILGTDKSGYDIFVRLMAGGKISLTIGFIVVILETVLGVLMGGIAGYFGGWADQIIMRIVDIFNCIPTLPILLIASAVIESWNVPSDQRIYLLMVIITLFGWSGVARLVRGQILSLREQEYMTATEVMGIPVWRRIFVHLLPNVMPQLIVSMTLGLGSVILYESTLSYLGLGVQPPKAAWGTMIATANETDILQFHMNMWLPAGILIVIAVLGFNFIGDGLRDAMDPKARK